MITVRIPARMLEKIEHEVHTGIYTLKQLREAGVPVVGVLWLGSVERGALTVEDDLATGDRLYTWSE